MKWFAQYFLSPLIAATVAVWGNYYFVAKDEIEKEYTKLGVDILLQENVTERIRILGEKLLEKNSPVTLTATEKEIKLRNLTSNIPLSPIPDHMTWGQMAIHYFILVTWANEVAIICPDCINVDAFNDEYSKAKNTFPQINQNAK